METDPKGQLRVKPDPEFQGNKYFVPKDGIPDKAAFIGGWGRGLLFWVGGGGGDGGVVGVV